MGAVINYGSLPRLSRSLPPLDYFQLNPRCAAADHVDFLGRGQGQVNNSILGERATVIHHDDDLQPVFQIRYAQSCSERIRPVGRRQIMHIENLTARRQAAVKFMRVVGRHARRYPAGRVLQLCRLGRTAVIRSGCA